MEEHLKLIYKKIDASLTNEESETFDMLFHSNPQFVDLYEKQVSLDNALTNLPLEVAPKGMLENIMQQVSVPRESYAAKYGSFGGIKYIALGLIVLTVVGVLIAVFFQQDVTFESSPSRLATWINQYMSFEGILTAMTGHLKYGFLIVPALVLIWLDLVLRHNKLIYKTVN
ncbi:MAG: hypothetical protein HKO66_01150 [Saprospiraceae bacterium]|nr:hypothetical protein [Bacteroidia bacterium]NNE14870.1 hypothetical protein [Saprospiraceae bacterium]NNL90815.1 hypothetical protein [Saprospiraceae bacterium]